MSETSTYDAKTATYDAKTATYDAKTATYDAKTLGLFETARDMMLRHYTSTIPRYLAQAGPLPSFQIEF